MWMRRQLRWRRRTRSSFASLDSSTRSARSPPAQVRQNRHRPAKVWRRRRRRRRRWRRRQATARWRRSCSKATEIWTAADFGRSSTPLLHRRSVLRYHAHAMHTPCARHAHTLRLAVCEQVRAAATLGMVQSFRRGGQTTLSITPELRERLDGCGASSAVPCLEAVMERVRTAAQLALGGGVLYPCGSLLIRLAHPHAASLVAPWGGTVQVPPCECLRPLP